MPVLYSRGGCAYLFQFDLRIRWTRFTHLRDCFENWSRPYMDESRISTLTVAVTSQLAFCRSRCPSDPTDSSSDSAIKYEVFSPLKIAFLVAS
jgi:hypothetical protein